MDNNPDGCAITLHLGNIPPDLELAQTISPLLGGMNKGTLLGLVPNPCRDEKMK